MAAEKHRGSTAKDAINEAFDVLPREWFLPDDTKPKAGVDTPLPIGFNQTNSQPSLVKQMLEWLDVHPGNKVLDVGSGSGWTSVLLAYLVEPGGKVFAIEKVPQLVTIGKLNVQAVGMLNVRFFEAGGEMGLSDYAPYDRILVSTSADDVPEELIQQLRLGGKIVIPVKNDILEIVKEASRELRVQKHSGFRFVPSLR